MSREAWACGAVVATTMRVDRRRRRHPTGAATLLALSDELKVAFLCLQPLEHLWSHVHTACQVSLWAGGTAWHAADPPPPPPPPPHLSPPLTPPPAMPEAWTACYTFLG